MAFHHVAMAVRDIEASHRFYTEAMGFELVKVDVVPIRKTGWARHLFYETGDGGMLALWDIHDEKVSGFDPAISTGLGLPVFVNHIAFVAADLEDGRTAGWRTGTTWCGSTMAGASRSTPPTRTARWWSTASRPGRSTPPTGWRLKSCWPQPSHRSSIGRLRRPVSSRRRSGRRRERPAEAPPPSPPR
jgi:catechol 2,3-dioxygenase-like lactoylglutathione lyase family enzyme